MTFPLSFTWEKQNNLPYAGTMEYWCIANGRVYVNTYGGYLVEYTPSTDTWLDIPTPTKDHGMLSLNGKLTLVGGQMKESGEHSPIVRVWDSDLEQWTEPYPRMPMGRRDPGCATYHHYLIVAGGDTDRDLQIQTTTSVEILDTRNDQWFKAPPMMYNGSSIRSVTIGPSLYLFFTYRGVITSSKSLLRVSLPTLISHTLQGKNRDTSIWEKMPDVPLYRTTLFSIGNMLLTAGGTPSGTFSGALSAMHFKKNKPSADIHLFNPHTSQWLKIGELPESRMACACTELPSGKLLVAGGQGNDLLPTVYTATIVRSYF